MQILPFWVLYKIQKPIYPQKKNSNSQIQKPIYPQKKIPIVYLSTNKNSKFS